MEENQDVMSFGFVIDNVGDQTSENESPEDQIVGNIFQQFMQEKLNTTKKKPESTVTKASTPFEKFSHNMDFTSNPFENVSDKDNKKDYKKLKQDLLEMKKDKTGVDKVLEKSIVLQPGFDELKSVPSQVVSDKKLKLQRKLEREKSKGNKWFNMPATEMTEEVKKDLQVLQMRSVLDPKHFYKKNDLKVLPKFFQVGRVMDSPLDYYNSRLTKKERKRTLVDELLADAEFTKYNKKKYNEIQVEKQKTHYKAYREAKRLKKKKK